MIMAVGAYWAGTDTILEVVFFERRGLSSDTLFANFGFFASWAATPSSEQKELGSYTFFSFCDGVVGSDTIFESFLCERNACEHVFRQ